MVSKDLIIRDMSECDGYYVGTCTHVDESEEIDVCSEIRNEWFEEMYERGLRINVALLEGEHVGFIYMLPIEISPWGPLGEDLMFIPCLSSVSDEEGKKVGQVLIDSAEDVAKEEGKKGILTRAYISDSSFMPAEFFKKCGFETVKCRELEEEGYIEVLMWKIFDHPVNEVDFLEKDYEYEPVNGKVVIDLFWNTFCQTSVIEANRVKKIVEEYGDRVLLNEYRVHDRDDLLTHGIYRGIFVNGEEIFWGYEAPEKGIREAVERGLE